MFGRQPTPEQIIQKYAREMTAGDTRRVYHLIRQFPNDLQNFVKDPQRVIDFFKYWCETYPPKRGGNWSPRTMMELFAEHLGRDT